MDDATLDRLTGERTKGKRAELVYKNWVQPFTKSKREVLWEAFQVVSITDVDGILEIKRTLKAIDALDAEFKTFIESGKMASVSISEEMKKREEKEKVNATS